MLDMNAKVTGVKLTKACSIKADKDSTTSKKINLVIDFNDVPLADVFAKAVSGAVIQWQNGKGRDQFDTLKDNQTVEIKFASPAAKVQVDPVTAMLQAAAAEGISIEDYLRKELAKRQ